MEFFHPVGYLGKYGPVGIHALPLGAKQESSVLVTSLNGRGQSLRFHNRFRKGQLRFMFFGQRLSTIPREFALGATKVTY